MSLYSGKCDFADMVDIWGIEKAINADVYLYDSLIPLRIETEKDLVPFYPFLTSCQIWKDGKAKVWLTKSSYIDIEEAEHLGWYKRDLVRAWRRCKRKKETFVPEEAVERVSYFASDKEKEEVLLELARRVQEKGDKASTEGLHLPMWERYRKDLYDEMIRVGYTPFQATSWIWKVYDYNLLKEDKNGEAGSGD